MSKVFCGICGEEIVKGGNVARTKGDVPRHPNCIEMPRAEELPRNRWIRVSVQGRGEISMEIYACLETGTGKPHVVNAKDLRGTLYHVQSRFDASGSVVGYNGTEMKP